MYEISEPLFEKIKCNVPKVNEPGDVAVWISKSPDPYLLYQCLKHNIFDHVVDWKKFIKALPFFRINPYQKEDKGEDPNEYIKVRDAVHQQLPEEDTAKFESQLLQRRYSFATWALWNLPANKGKMYMPLSTIIAFCTKKGVDDIEEFYKHLRKHPGGAKGVMISADLFEAEQKIERLLTSAAASPIPAINSGSLDSSQNATINNMLASSFSALQGGAGVGKTTTVGHLIKAIINNGNSVSKLSKLSKPPPTIFCLAFTHKAKRCIAEKLAGHGILPENTQVRVSTIHSFIATYNRQESSIPPCYILIDEASMIDIDLLAELADTVVLHCAEYQLGFVGDMMQLPPITRGEFYRHLVSTPGKHVNELHKCYRTDKPDLFAAYEAVRNGSLPPESPNFKIVHADNDAQINSHIGKLIIKHTDMLQDKIQFIAWQNKDVYKINQWVQSALLKQRKIGPESYRGFYNRDKIIYRGENTKQLTNALTGRIISISQRYMLVQWDDGQQTQITHENIASIQLAYALTVHSLQGSECERVIIACYDVNKMKYCLDRRFLYTAISRGKQDVTVITTKDINDFLNAPIRPPPLTGITIPSI